ncbi:uncharacterized protein CDAR_66761 [Caerostris darwini]|uniref:Uncharacterized protein n=1 Tax=Caerostris darwini TaxID=1538125 RepID=A0AAV4T9C1_9ARAC|nr:uncharacterized protein CDAR_66761 [Caerostris darwini]
MATGIPLLIPSIVKNYFKQTWYESLDQHPTISHLYKQYGESGILAQFGHKTIQFKLEYKLKNYHIIRITYIPCKDVIYGLTRYYRGEYLLIDKQTDNVKLLRSGLPTFAMEQSKVQIFDHIIATPKYDGSLVNILFVPVNHSNYTLLKDLFQEENVHHNQYGLFFIGSKQKLIMLSNLRNRFDEAIHVNIDEFINSYTDYFKDQTCMRTLHFEIMNEKELDGLTVYYSQNFYKFIGCTTFTDDTHSFALAKSTDKNAVEQYVFPTWEKCRDFVSDQHNQLLNGNVLIEPEGFVFYIWNTEGQLMDVVKKCKEIPNITIGAFDLETIPLDGEDRVPTGHDETDRIVMISIVKWNNTNNLEKIVMYLNPIKESLNINGYEYFEESEMLKDFHKIIEDCHVLTDYGSCIVMLLEEYLKLPEVIRNECTVVPYRTHEDSEFLIQNKFPFDVYKHPEINNETDKAVMIWYHKEKGFLPQIIEHFLEKRLIEKNSL